MFIFKKIPNKEMEETMLSDTHQMKKLYEQIEELKEIIKNKDIEINLLEDKISILEKIIDNNNTKNDDNLNINKNDINIPKFMPAHKLIEEDEIFINDNYQRKEFNVKIDDKPEDDEESSSDSENTNNEFILRPPKVNLNNCLYEYYKNKENEKTKPNSGCEKRYRRDRDKTLPPIQRYPPKIYNYSNTKNTELFNFISSENKILIKFQSMIAEKIIEDNVWEDIYQFKIINNELKDSSTAKKRFKYKILRSKILYDKYEEKLSKFEIYLSHLGEMSDNEWELWLKDFDKIFIDTYKDIEGCLYIYKTGKKEGQKCGVHNCNNKRHIDK